MENNFLEKESEIKSDFRQIEKVGFVTRLIANILDSVIIMIISFAAGIFLGIVFFGILHIDIPEIVFKFIGYGISVSYVLGMWIFADGATLGKKVMKIKIVKTDGRPIEAKEAVLRYIGYFISGFVFGLGFLWIIWDKEKQGWHDKIAGTIVIKSGTDIHR